MNKAEFLVTLSSLRKQEASINIDIDSFLNKQDQCEFKNELLELGKSERKALKVEQNNFLSSIQKANENIANFKQQIQAPDKDMVSKLQVIMNKIEDQLSEVKQYQKSVYDTLLSTESALTKALANFTKELPRYKRVVIPLSLLKTAPSKTKSHRETNDQLHPAVVEFEKYRTEFGVFGGWGDFEHQVFTKHFTEEKSDDEVLAGVRLKLPLKSDEDIQQHLQWYRKYCKLEAAKRDALVEWKQQRDKKIKLPDVGNVEDDAKKLKELDEKRRTYMEKEREQRMAQLNAYRVQKELQRVLQEEAALQKKLDDAEKEQRRKEYHHHQKERVKNYQAQKQALAEEKKAKTTETSTTGKVSRSQILHLHKRNMAVLEQKQAAKHNKLIQEFTKQQKLEELKSSVEVRVKRDPKRLFQKTQGQIHREADNSHRCNTFVGSRHMPHRATPAWRKGL